SCLRGFCCRRFRRRGSFHQCCRLQLEQHLLHSRTGSAPVQSGGDKHYDYHFLIPGRFQYAGKSSVKKRPQRFENQSCLKKGRSMPFEISSRQHVRHPVKVLVCRLDGKFTELLAADAGIFKEFYPFTTIEAARSIPELLAMIQSGYDIVHLFAEI